MNETIYELIRLHNQTIDDILDFASTIVEEYKPTEDVEAPINVSFSNLMLALSEAAINLCCEANGLKDGNSYYTDSNWRVLADE